MAQALLLIDIQNDYFPGGAMEVEGSIEAAKACAKLLARQRERGLPVVHVRHLSVRPGAGFLLENTDGSKINPLVAPIDGEEIIIKNYPNSFSKTNLGDHLKELGANSLLICGMMTHMCIDTTVRAGFDLGYTVTLASDGCATRALTHGELTIPAAHVQGAYLASLGSVFAKIATVEELLRQA